MSTTGVAYDAAGGPVGGVASGGGISLLDPSPDDVRLEDIAWHLAGINRFLGATSAPVSVAAHSLAVLALYRHEFPGAGPDELRAALMHDAHEAYLGDMTRPVKQALATLAPGAWAALEQRMQAAIDRRFGLPSPPLARLHRADDLACALERQAYIVASTLDWSRLPAAPIGLIRERALLYYTLNRHRCAVEFVRAYNALEQASAPIKARLRPEHPATRSPRVRSGQVLELVLGGMTDLAIADKLGTKLTSVRNHIHRLRVAGKLPAART